MNESAISIIQDYANRNLTGSTYCLGSYNLQKQSYFRAAIDEITGRLIEQEPLLPWDAFRKDSKTPVEIIAEFIGDMECFAELSAGKPEKQAIFETAKEAAEDVLRLFL
jgi:hypothetical protein